MIVVTGTEGFIASVLVEKLILRGYKDIVCVDLKNNLNETYINRFDYPYIRFKAHSELPEFIQKNHKFIQFIVHLGACSNTTLKDKKVFDELNVEYSKNLWNRSVEYGIPMLYASSAATYGDGQEGYSDSHDMVSKLKPLNMYGQSKQIFDMWALDQKDQPVFWAGLKFFNVYGRNEYHKGSMASVVLHAYNQIKDKGYVELFRSHRSDCKDGEQSRDFVYVDDVCDVMIHFMENMPPNGIYNVGTGINRSFADLVTATFKALNLKPDIKYIDTPLKLRDQYQYYTRAEISKLRSAGYIKEFTTLEDGVADYVRNYLAVAKKLAV